MFSYVFAFLFGLLVPAIASRYGKVYASDLGEWLFYLWHKPHFPQKSTTKRRSLLRHKWYKLFLFSLFWAVLLSCLFVFTDHFVPNAARIWVKTFILIMALLSAIDQQFFLLPDIFTVPLLSLGFGYAIFGGVISPNQSFIGSCYGFILPAIAVFLTSAFFHNAFGGGDVKMLAGLGAWVGLFPLTVIVFISVISFTITAIITKKRTGAYGPHLAFAAIIVLFLTTNNLLPFL